MKVYLAGYDVFRPDAVEHGVRLKALCESSGLIGLYPLDNELQQGMARQDAASWICQQNMAMIRECDAVLANLGNFRGHEPDSGTAFECGVAVALGKPVWVYFPEQRPLIEQLQVDRLGRCQDGYAVEDFNLPKNLMLATQWAGVSTSVEKGIEALAHYLVTKRKI